MKLTKDDIRTMAKAINLQIPDEADLNTIAIRLSSLLEIMGEIEKDLGPEMDKVDPVPPVFPPEDF